MSESPLQNIPQILRDTLPLTVSLVFTLVVGVVTGRLMRATEDSKNRALYWQVLGGGLGVCALAGIVLGLVTAGVFVG